MDRDRSKRRPRKARRIAPAATVRASALDCYLDELRRERVLTRTEELAMVARAQSGDDVAREQLIRSNLRFVVSVAKKYQNRGLPLEDIISAGNLGLVKAVGTFDPAKGVKLITYAVWLIRAAIGRAVAGARPVRIPASSSAAARLIVRTADLLHTRLHRPPTPEEIAQVAELPVETVTVIVQALGAAVSLSTPLGDEEGYTLGDVLPDEEATGEDLLETKELAAEIDAALDTLRPREAQILRLYFGIGETDRQYTLEEIGAELGITRERVRQLRDRALRRMRDTTKLSA